MKKIENIVITKATNADLRIVHHAKKAKTPRTKFPFAQMSVMSKFTVPYNTSDETKRKNIRNSVHQAVHYYQKNYGGEFATRNRGTHVVVVRTA